MPWDAANISYSLCLIQVDLTLCVLEDDVRRRLQGRFRYRGTDYSMWVTDPAYEDRYLRKPHGDYQHGNCFITVSLGAWHTDGNAYKLIAAIMKP